MLIEIILFFVTGESRGPVSAHYDRWFRKATKPFFLKISYTEDRLYLSMRYAICFTRFKTSHFYPLYFREMYLQPAHGG